MRLIAVLATILITLSCEAQTGGIGFWGGEPIAPEPSEDSVQNVMPIGPFVVVKKGSSDVMYLADTINSRIIRYYGQANIASANGLTICKDLRNIAEIKYHSNKLFILDSLNMRVTSINLSTLDADVIYKTDRPEKRLWSIAGVINPATNSFEVHAFIPYYTQPGLSFRYDRILSIFDTDSLQYRGTTSRQSNPDSYNHQDYNLINTKIDGSEKLILMTNAGTNLATFTRDGIMLEWDNVENAWEYSFPSGDVFPDVASLSGELPSTVSSIIYNMYAPSVDWGSDRVAIVTNTFPTTFPYGYWRFIYQTASNADGPYIVSVYSFSPVIDAASKAMYLMVRDRYGFRSLLRLNENGTYTNLRGLY